MIVIHPPDPTTNFLSIIVEEITKKSIKIDCPVFISNKDSRDYIKDQDPSRTILFMGHGNSEYLNSSEGRLMSIVEAKEVFKNKKIILLSCYSADFIDLLDGGFETAIGFGNIITSQRELENLPSDAERLFNNGFDCIDLFRDRLTHLFKNSIIESCSMNYSFIQLYNILKLRINKVICNCSLSKDKTELLVGKLMFYLKKEMVLIGNLNAPVN